MNSAAYDQGRQAGIVQYTPARKRRWPAVAALVACLRRRGVNSGLERSDGGARTTGFALAAAGRISVAVALTCGRLRRIAGDLFQADTLSLNCILSNIRLHFI